MALNHVGVQVIAKKKQAQKCQKHDISLLCILVNRPLGGVEPPTPTPEYAFNSNACILLLRASVKSTKLKEYN